MRRYLILLTKSLTNEMAEEAETNKNPVENNTLQYHLATLLVRLIKNFCFYG